jgi:hypothetical protein
VTKIADRCQDAVRAASAGYRAPPSEKATSRVVTRSVLRRRAPRRRYTACFVCKHLVPLCNSFPYSTRLISVVQGRGPRTAVSEGMGVSFNHLNHAGTVLRYGKRPPNVGDLDQDNPGVLLTTHLKREGLDGSPRPQLAER